MEKEYATAGSAALCLVCGTGDGEQYMESEAALRSVLQRRPVVLGFVMSTIANKLREGASGQPHLGRQKSGPPKMKMKKPHTGIRLALEVVLGFYDPSTPQRVAAVVDALGEDRLQALLHGVGGAAQLLPWPARLCLLHACLAGASAGGRTWEWLPTAADSACSLALQAITTEGGNNSGASCKGIRCARPSSARDARAGATGITGALSPTVIAAVCAELASAGSNESPSAKGIFRGGCLSNGLRGAESGSTSAGAIGVFQGGYVLGERGGDWLQAFRFKLQALRDALLVGTETNGKVAEHQEEQRSPLLGSTMMTRCDVMAEDVDVEPKAVERALERSSCDGAFVLSVQAALKAEERPAKAPESRKRIFLSGDGDDSVKLKHVLTSCLFGVGLPGNQGLLPRDAELDIVLSSSASTERTIDTRSSGVTRACPEMRRACALMQGLVAEGVRIRDLLLTLLDMQREQQRSSAEPSQMEVSCWRTGAEVMDNVLPRRDVRRMAVTAVIGAFVEWLADNAWVWEAAEEAEGIHWEADIAAAATAVAVAFSAPPVSGGSVDSGSIGTLLHDARKCHQGLHGGSDRTSAADGPGADTTVLLDRLVAGAAAAIAHVDAHEVEWIYVVRRMTAAAGTVSAGAYATACVEKSVALGGQAPFRVDEKLRLSQVEGQALWGLLAQACELRRDSMGSDCMPTAAFVRTAAAAVMACRKLSRSWMISPGLLRSGPIRLVIDMLSAANGCVALSDLLGGLMARPGEEGPAFAADFFAAIIAAEMGAGGGSEGVNGEGTTLHFQAVAWLSGALSATNAPANPTVSSPIYAIAVSTALARLLTRRVPFEAKAVLLAVEEATKIAAGKLGAGAPHSSRRDDVSGKGQSSRRAAVESLLEVARAATQSPLLPLPVLVSSPLPRWGGGEGRKAAEGKALAAIGGGKKALKTDGRQADASAASVTAGLLLGAFVQSPGSVRRTIQEAVQRRDCNHELLAVQRALRLALCSSPLPAGQSNNSILASDNGIASPLLAGLAGRRAPACLLIGHLVESGVPGWEETKAAMIPPPPQLVEVAEAPVREEAASRLHSGSRQRLTALRLELWLRSLLHDVDGDYSGLDVELKNSIPDVFRTARTLARTVSRHAFATVTGGEGDGAGANGHHPFRRDCDFGSVESIRRSYSNGDGRDRREGTEQEHAVDGTLEPPRRALARRVPSALRTGALMSWVSSLVTIIRQYRQWLPWQAFADELRDLVLLSVRRTVQTGGAHQNGTGEGPPASAAALFAACELLAAWEGGAEVPAAVFGPSLCSSALNTAVAPVPAGLGPPVWLEVLRCLIDEESCDISGWAPSRSGGRAKGDPLALAAAASTWIGGGGPGAGNAWMSWYGAKLGSLIPTSNAAPINWLVLADADGSTGAGVQVRAGVGWAARVVRPQEWQDWGRSPLQAAWNVPAEWRMGKGGSDTNPGLPPIVLPPFAAWLRVVLRGGPSCAEGVLEGYLRRMAREVYLPCEFGGASGEMARQWLGALIEAEAGAEARAQKSATPVTMASAATVSPDSSYSAANVAAARQLAVKSFFREELLRFGSGEAPVAPVGGPLTWLWPLEAVVAACGRAGPLGGGRLVRHRGACKGSERTDGPKARAVLDSSPSALARALHAVPHDLLCGSRRFGMGGGQPPPATLRAFSTRAVDLAARALATPPCRHWSVARRLLLGLGLLYHALAKSETASATDLAPSSGTVKTTAGNACTDAEAAAAQTTALSTIASLIQIALGSGGDVPDGPQNGRSAGVDGEHRGAPTCKTGTPLLPSACRTLRPLESVQCAGVEQFAEALRDAGAWRAATAFCGPRDVEPNRPLASPAPSDCVRHGRHRHSSSETVCIPQAVCEHPVGANGANGPSAAGSDDDRKKRRRGERELHSLSQDAPSLASTGSTPKWKTPSAQKATSRSKNDSTGKDRPASSPRRVLPVRATRRSDRANAV